MTETKDTTEKTIRGGVRKPLSLQRTVESGHVRQNFSHGRSKSVVVEKRRTRKLASPGGEPEAEAPVVEAAPEAPAPKKRPVKAEAPAQRESVRRAGRQNAVGRGARRPRPCSGRRPRPRGRRACRARKDGSLPRASPQLPAAARAKPERAPEARPATAKAEPLRRPDAGAGRRAPLGAKARPSLNPALQPREGGKPREIDIPVPPRAKPEVEAPKRSGPRCGSRRRRGGGRPRRAEGCASPAPARRSSRPTSGASASS